MIEQVSSRRSEAVCRRQAGFTLLEVLVAFTILAVSLGVLLGIFSGSLRRQNMQQDQRTALALAESKLAAIGSEISLADGLHDGIFDNGFGWQLEIKPYSTDNTKASLVAKRATLRVFWPASNGPHSVTLQTVEAVGRDQ